MPSVKFLVDDMCANLTEELLYRLVKTLVAERPSTIGDIAGRIVEKDHSLDIKSAHILAEAAVEALWKLDDIVIEGDYIHPGGSRRD